MSASDRALLVFLLLPPAAALMGFAVGAATGWFVDPLMMVIGILFAVIAQVAGPRPEPGVRGGPRWPWALLGFVALYFLLKFDLSHYHLLGVNGPASHALGIGLGEGAADPLVNRTLGLAPLVPEGQVVLATAAQALAGTLGARLLFAWVFVGLALVGWRLALHAVPDRPRLALFTGALCALNPAFMECVGLDSLGNALPALFLGVALLAATTGAKPLTVALAAGLAISMRPTLALGLLPMLAVILARSDDRRGLAQGYALGLALPLGLLGMWRLASGHPLFFDPGLTPLGVAAMDASASAWWWDPGTRAPWSDGPAWMVGLTGALGRLGTVGALVLLVGLAQLRRMRPLATLIAVATLPALALFLLRGPAMSGEQHDRLLIFVVPGGVLLALGLQRLAIAARAGGRSRLAWTGALVVASTALMAGGNGLREASFPVDQAAYQSFERLLPQSPDAVRPAPNGPLWWLPGFTPMHLLDPLVDQSGQRWRDLAWHIGHPAIRERPMSIDERALARTKGDEFRRRWLPNHRLGLLPVTAGPGADPYGETTPLLIEIDLSAALTEGRVGIQVVDSGTPDVDLASKGGPFRRQEVQLGADQRVVDVTLWKEYRSATDAETAVVVMPRWDRLSFPDRTGLPGGTLLVSVPSRGFLSVVVVLGERADAMALIAALEWNVGLRPGGELEIFGPFRL